MNFYFEEIRNRRHTGSVKWDVQADELPMWMADMDFQTAPEITRMIMERAKQGIFGYTQVTDEWYEAYQTWWKERHHFAIHKDWLIFSTGVVPAISSIIRKVTTVGENVLVMSPVYNIFYNSILNNRRNVLENRLLYDGKEYHIDFQDLEEKLSCPQTTLLILCNPHNPIGKIWDKEILEKIGALCMQYHVIVLSDEIHCDLTEPGWDYTPFASVSESCKYNSITCVAPTKTFNLAGVQTAAVFVPDDHIRHKVRRGLNTDEVAEPNVFAAIAPVAAFLRGKKWLESLRKYLWENRAYAEHYIKEEITGVSTVAARATYLLWIDCRNVTEDSKKFCQFIRSHSGLYLSAGNEYHNGEGFLRMNLACPRPLLDEGLQRLKDSVEAY